ncbi:MAG: cation-translocating P-type ATPase [Victivallaceae bacterium]|nr:cation-translocating P-type ATPase [Victivallaceae bacterium]
MADAVTQPNTQAEHACCDHDHHEHNHEHTHNHSPADVKQALGISCPTCGEHHSEGAGHDRSMGRIVLALFGGMFVVNSFILEAWLPQQVFINQISSIIGAALLAFPIISTAIRDLTKGKVYMNELVALAILAACAGGNFRMAGIIAFFLLLTIIIETRTASGAQRSIEELVKLTPSTAHKLINGQEVEAEALDLQLGDIIRVRPGENFPVDGEVLKGESTVNQASITGESLPLEKEPGDQVFAGTQNLTGGIEIKVTKIGEDTTLGKVKDMILAAESSRSPIVRIIDNYAGYYTPTVLMMAGVTWWFSDGDINRVITLMVIACPCAIVLATPTAVVAAVAAAARLGILIKNVSHLELAAKVRSFVFDKTGTLTDGLLSVVKLNPVEGIASAELLKVAASAEQQSNHPTAIALQKLAVEAELQLDHADEFSEVHGKGVQAVIGGVKYSIGRPAWLESLGLNLGDMSEGQDDDGMSVVYAAKGDKLLGWIGFKDKIRKAAPEMITDLKKLGVKHCAMVTGDRESVATKVAAALQIDEYISECLPETKVDYVEKTKEYSTVAVVGDGVNDAPALAAGDLGIVMGAIGSDIAVNSASIALMTNDLRRIPMLVYLSRKSRVIINQNLFVGMLFVFGGMIISVFGWMTPIWAAVLHTLSTLLIIFNSARLVRTGEELTLEEE